MSAAGGPSDAPGTPDPKPDGNGQTGSVGSSECSIDSECEDHAEAYLASLREPAAGPSRTFSGSECSQLSVISDHGSASGNACMCIVGGGGSVNVGPRGAGCFALGRAESCLWDDSEWEDCDPSDPRACDAVCDELAARYAADDARTFDAELLTAKCDQGNCRSAVKIDAHCYGPGTPWSEYDCALGGDGILAQAAADAAPKPPASGQPEPISPYVSGSDGFAQLTVAHAFEGATAMPVAFGAFWQFYDPLTGDESAGADVLDPLEGTDDCGVFRGTGVGTAAAIHWRKVGEATLRDGGDALPLDEFMSGDLFSYVLELDRAPRFGGSYGVHVAGGQFGAAFDSDQLSLPQDLALAALQRARIEQGELTLSWTGTGADPLRIRWLLTDATGGELELQCVVKDDGAFTIPADVLARLPDGEVNAYVTRSQRKLQSAGGHMILLDAKIENSYRFMFGAP